MHIRRGGISPCLRLKLVDFCVFSRRHQRQLSIAVKRARELALLPYVKSR